MAHNMDMHDHERIQMCGFEVEGFRVSGLRLGLRVSMAKSCGRWGLGPGILGVAKNQLCNMLGGGGGGGWVYIFWGPHCCKPSSHPKP